jgi:hypothetical protein
MKKFIPLALLATITTFAVVPAAVHAQGVAAKTGKMLYAANGQRIASVYHVTADGSAEIIVDGKLYVVSATTLSDVGGKLTSSLSKRDITSAR